MTTRAAGKPSVAELLAVAAVTGEPLVQPRCGVGGHAEMLALLTGLQDQADPGILTVTIDSHTRLLQFASVDRALAADPASLNGYPLVTHGPDRGRELDEAVRAPIQVRHGSPDPRPLFAASAAAGFTSFEGGGISYNVPYAKDVPITDSLRHWQEVDRQAGELTAAGVTVDRELFGTLTAVLMPPSVCLAVTLIEAALAVAEGVRCVSIAYPQGGHPWQDLAALRAIETLAARYLGPHAGTVHPVLHQFMGVFPADRQRARELISYGGVIAALGRVRKVVTKSPAEASGIPTLAENADGIRLTRHGIALAPQFGIDEAAVAAEQEAIEREVRDLVDPILERPDVIRAVGEAFEAGTLDVPFGASRFVRSAVMPCRDASGAIRFADPGGLPFSAASRRRNDELVAARGSGPRTAGTLLRDVNYFADGLADPALFLPSAEPTLDGAR
ncbi:MAG: methylaspartate mutase epsilon subunit [Cryptosporangiaceae bacterium]|nr:methylaspartate mutase epsilon subunit [Cryptosporangiaceae bacterium]